jgi:hypothetical protein
MVTLEACPESISLDPAKTALIVVDTQNREPIAIHEGAHRATR